MTRRYEILDRAAGQVVAGAPTAAALHAVTAGLVRAEAATTGLVGAVEQYLAVLDSADEAVTGQSARDWYAARKLALGRLRAEYAAATGRSAGRRRGCTEARAVPGDRPPAARGKREECPILRLWRDDGVSGAG